MLSRALSLLALLCDRSIGVAKAQTDEIVVTGSRVNGDDYPEFRPLHCNDALTLLVQRIRLVNDTRSDELRRKELYQTVHGLLSDAAKRPASLWATEQEFLVPISERRLRIPLDSGGKRADTSSTSIYVKMALGRRTTYRRRSQHLQRSSRLGASSVEQKIEPEARLL